MYDRILVPTDGSDPATAAIDSAVTLAERFDADCHAIHVSPSEAETRHPGGDGNAERVLDGIEDRAAGTGVEVTTARLHADGPIHRTVVDYAADNDADLVVLGTRGRTGLGRFVLGSVTERTLRAAPPSLPVLTVHAGGPLGALDDVLVATDGSDSARAAVGHAIDLAAVADATLHVVHVVDVTVAWPTGSGGRILDTMEAGGREAVDRAIDRAERADLSTIEATLLSGSPYRAIVDYAADEAVDCTVLGTHGRTGFDRLILGSVAERVIRISETPVFAVKAQDPEVAEAGTWNAVDEE